MSLRKTLLTTSVLATISGVAWAQGNLPNPNPFPSRDQPQQQQPIIVQPPAVTVQAPAADSGWLGWVFAAIGSIATVIFGVKTGSDLTTKKFDFSKLIADPSVKAQLDRLILDAANIQAVRGAVQQTPTVGMLEPMIHSIVQRVLESRLATNQAAAQGSEVTVPAQLLQKLADLIEKKEQTPHV
jgi:hypothetical protein